MAQATFSVGTTVETTDNFVDVAASSNLPVGVHHFQLVVEDDSGNQSAPIVVQIIVKDTTKPTAILTVMPSQVEAGQGFRLDGSKSSDPAPGKIVKFRWTMLD